MMEARLVAEERKRLPKEEKVLPNTKRILPKGLWFLPFFVSMMKKPPFFDEKRGFFDSKKGVFLTTNRRLAEAKSRKAKIYSGPDCHDLKRSLARTDAEGLQGRVVCGLLYCVCSQIWGDIITYWINFW